MDKLSAERRVEKQRDDKWTEEKVGNSLFEVRLERVYRLSCYLAVQCVFIIKLTSVGHRGVITSNLNRDTSAFLS